MDSKIANEFSDFLSVQELLPDKRISQAILAQVTQDLSPKPGKVFSRLLIIHCLTAVVTLAVCPQFGIQLVGEGMGLMKFFMALGKYGCVLACGSFFTGLSLLVASQVLRPEEVKVI